MGSVMPKIEFNTKGPYCYKIQGTLYHSANPLYNNNEEDTPKYAQLYILDSGK